MKLTTINKFPAVFHALAGLDAERGVCMSPGVPKRPEMSYPQHRNDKNEANADVAEYREREPEPHVCENAVARRVAEPGIIHRDVFLNGLNPCLHPRVRWFTIRGVKATPIRNGGCAAGNAGDRTP